MFALFVLYSYPLVVVILFQQYRLSVALTVSVVGGYLLLPGQIGHNLPLLPTLDKILIPSASALIMTLVVLNRKTLSDRVSTIQTAAEQNVLPGWIPRTNITRLFLLMIFGGAFMTTVTNGDSLLYGPRFLPALSIRDALSAVMTIAGGLLPFLLARKLLAHPDSHRTVLLILAIAGLLYSLPALYEIRMSPQLNRMIYGFFPHSWVQHIRGNGFRPIVFLDHGLRLGIFLAGAISASLLYVRLGRDQSRWFYLGAALWLLATLVLAKTLGALAIAMAFIPVVLFFGVRLQLLAAAMIALVVLTYPMLRGVGFVPVEQITTFAEKIDVRRAGSLRFRLDNEDILLEKANQRPAFGWGGWGRNRVYNDVGRDLSVTDGSWIIIAGQGGWVRYIAQFGLLTLPIILLALNRRRYQISLATSGLAIVLATSLLDLIPNSGLTPVTWLMAGALMGRLELQRIEQGSTQTVPVLEPGQTSRYSRARPDPATVLADQADPADQPRAKGGLTYTRQRKLKPGTDGAKT